MLTHLFKSTVLCPSTFNKPNYLLNKLLSSHHFHIFKIYSGSQRTFSSIMATTNNDFVKGSVHSNGVAVITLDRPKALNAMNLAMDLKFRHYLDEWETDPRVKCVLVESSSPRAFSAGGDVKQITAKHQKSDMIEKTVLAMPENAIGLFPDVGFSYIAAKSPGEGAVGTYLGMTGNKISSPADALYVGLGTHYVPSTDLASLKEALTAFTFSGDAHKDIKELVTRHSKEPKSEAPLKLIYPQIVSSFGSNKPIVEIMEDLKMLQKSPKAAVAEWASGTLMALGKGAPFSLCLTKEYFSRVVSALGNPENHLSNLIGVMKTEYRIAIRSSLRNDFVEGVRAVLVDKDLNPKWNPSRLEDVDWAEIQSVFEPLGPDEEELRL